MSAKSLAVISGEGFTAQILEWCDGRVEFTADADIDADGANGQFGARPAYLTDNSGSEDLANGGMGVRGKRVVGLAPWFRDIAIIDKDGLPRVFPRGIIASKTAYRYPGFALDDPAAYVDSQTISYIVVPPEIIIKTKGAVLGCRCRVTNLQNGRASEGMVGDVGPRNKVGEISIQCAKEIGIPESPRYGGADTACIHYEIWPGVRSKYPSAKLLRANGQHLD